MDSLENWLRAQMLAFESETGVSVGASALAPGRVNLIGEHTDYNDGLVLPCAIDLETLVLATRRSDRRVRVRARDLVEEGEFSTDQLLRRGGWLDYVQGIFFALQERGVEAPGFELGIASRLPMNSGLSSSAALGVALTAAISEALDLGFSARDWARIAHRGESGFVGVQCGILDPFASALGREGHALRIDCRSEEIDRIPILGADLAILLLHSGVERSLTDGFYERRVAECRDALEAAKRAGIASPTATALRDLGPAELPALERVLDPIPLRRARHVISENLRVESMCAALETGDLDAMGEVLAAGQASLRDDYAVSTPELDRLCELAEGCPGVVGSRLTGAGFGGFSLHLVEPDHLESVCAELERGFEESFGRVPRSLKVQISAGARIPFPRH